MFDGLIDADALALYEELVARGELIVGRPPQGLAEDDPRVLALLQNGLADALMSDDVHRLLPVAPAIGFSGLIDRLDDARHANPDFVRDVMARLNDVQERFVQASRIDGTIGARILTDKRVTQAFSGAVNRLVRKQKMAWNTGPYTLSGPTRSLLDIAVTPDLKLVERVNFRSVCATRDVELPGARSTLDMLVEAGHHVRISERIPMKLIIADDDLAMIPLVPNGWSAVLVTDPALVAMLRTFFEAVWERAQPYAAHRSSGFADDESTMRNRQLLGLMAAGLKDEAIARQLAISVRTVRRHITEICESLGAATRFAAGVAAARAGWVTTQSVSGPTGGNRG